MDPGFYVIDIDGTLVTSDSEFKQGAAATYKNGFGFYPLMSYPRRHRGAAGRAAAAG